MVMSLQFLHNLAQVPILEASHPFLSLGGIQLHHLCQTAVKIYQVSSSHLLMSTYCAHYVNSMWVIYFSFVLTFYINLFILTFSLYFVSAGFLYFLIESNKAQCLVEYAPPINWILPTFFRHLIFRKLRCSLKREQSSRTSTESSYRNLHVQHRRCMHWMMGKPGTPLFDIWVWDVGI